MGSLLACTDGGAIAVARRVLRCGISRTGMIPYLAQSELTCMMYTVS